uniref:Ig-like domain-containing protein n=1 Tax=Cyprinus carpio TaxID=7962 RepID=A0A8C1X314_CYPCA
MSDECRVCLLGLIFLSSLLTGVSGVDETHVFISSGENVRLSCNNALHDCNSTTWNYNRFRNSTAVELIGLGIKKKNTERHERLSLGSDCSLNIRNISTEDYGLYICQQWTGVNRDQQQEPDAHVFLHVLHVSSSQTEISAGLSVTLFCQLFSYTGVSCDDLIRSERIQLFWVNQTGVKLTRSDSRYQISSSSDHCIITLTTTLLNEDDNREWRCEVTQRDQVKTSVTYTVKSSAQTNSTTAVIPVNSTHSQDPSTTNTHTTKAQTNSTTSVIPVNSTHSQDPSTTNTHTTKGVSGVDETHVFISSGENVRLSCNNTLHDCTSTTWNYNRFRDSAAVELIRLGIKKKDTESHERLSLGSDCSLNIRNISTEDYGSYTCRQYVNETDACVFLHVLHGNFIIM